jgi:hypothetical protein
MKHKNIFFFLLVITLAQFSFSQNTTKLDTITAEMASTRIDEEVIIKGKVVTTFFAEFSTGKPTFLNLEKPFPDNPIVIIIFEEELEYLGINAHDYKDKTVIVKGIVHQYKDEVKPFKYKPSITIYSKDQLIILDKK